MNTDDDKRPFIELTRAERRARARKIVFGNVKDEYLGNMWGWKFSFFSFVGLFLVGSLAIYGVYTGKIDLQKLEDESPSTIFESANPHLQKQDSTKH